MFNNNLKAYFTALGLDSASPSWTEGKNFNYIDDDDAVLTEMKAEMIPDLSKSGEKGDDKYLDGSNMQVGEVHKELFDFDA